MRVVVIEDRGEMRRTVCVLVVRVRVSGIRACIDVGGCWGCGQDADRFRVGRTAVFRPVGAVSQFRWVGGEVRWRVHIPPLGCVSEWLFVVRLSRCQRGESRRVGVMRLEPLPARTKRVSLVHRVGHVLFVRENLV